MTLKGPWFRCSQKKYGSVFFGKTGENRFDDPKKSFGVLYVGDTEACAFIETFGAKTGVSAVTQKELDLRKMSTLVSALPIEVVDLDGANLARLSADAQLFAGDHSVAQRWARAFYEHPDKPYGIRYRARHDPSLFSVALFECCDRLVSEASSYVLGDSANARSLAALLDRYNFALL